jgi:hypothetical protein
MAAKRLDQTTVGTDFDAALVLLRSISCLCWKISLKFAISVSVEHFGRQYTEFARRIGCLVNEFGQSPASAQNSADTGLFFGKLRSDKSNKTPTLAMIKITGPFVLPC